MGKRATCCAHLHPRQACRRDRGACDGVLRQLSVGMMYLLSARVPFSKQSWGSSTWLSCGLVRPLSVPKCDGPPLVTTSSPFSKQSDLKDWRWLQPGFAIFFPSAAAQESRPPALALSRGQHTFFSYLFNFTALGSSAGGCYEFIPSLLIIKFRKRGKDIGNHWAHFYCLVQDVNSNRKYISWHWY